MSKGFWDAVEVGMRQETGQYTFSAEEIIEFATEFDPQPFHLSQEAAEKSHFGALCASGWHTVSAWMRLNIDHQYRGLREAAGYTGGAPKLGASPGVRNVKWMHPVYAADTITYSSTVTGKRPGKQEGWGLMTFRTEGHNQNGVQVLSMDGAARVRIAD